jgi:hypothetical protein
MSSVRAGGSEVSLYSLRMDGRGDIYLPANIFVSRTYIRVLQLKFLCRSASRICEDMLNQIQLLEGVVSLFDLSLSEGSSHFQT